MNIEDATDLELLQAFIARVPKEAQEDTIKLVEYPLGIEITLYNAYSDYIEISFTKKGTFSGLF